MGVMKKAFCVWVAMYVYGCTPHRWTSWERVWKETAYRMFYPIVCAQWFNKFGTVDGTLPQLDAFKLLPVGTRVRPQTSPAEAPVVVFVVFREPRSASPTRRRTRGCPAARATRRGTPEHPETPRRAHLRSRRRRTTSSSGATTGSATSPPSKPPTRRRTRSSCGRTSPTA